MNKENSKLPVSRVKLIEAINKTYADTKLYLGECVDEERDFSTGLCRNSSKLVLRDSVLEWLHSDFSDSYPIMPEHNFLILSPRLYVSRDSVNQNQRLDTRPDDVDGYHHVVSHQHYEVYFRIDHDAKIISFRLGHYQKTLDIVVDAAWAWKVQRKKLIKCMNIEHLEKSWTDPFWAGWVVDIGWKVLEIKPII